jgi:hypothetical protein
MASALIVSDILLGSIPASRLPIEPAPGCIVDRVRTQKSLRQPNHRLPAHYKFYTGFISTVALSDSDTN